MGMMFGRKNYNPIEGTFDFTELPTKNANFVNVLESFSSLNDLSTLTDNMEYFINENTPNEPEFVQVYEKLSPVLAKFNQLANNEENFMKQPNLHAESFEKLYPFIMHEVRNAMIVHIKQAFSIQIS